MTDRDFRGEFELSEAGMILASLISGGPATTRQLAGRLAEILDFDPETYWDLNGESLTETLRSELGRVNYFNGIWSIATGPEE